MRRLVFALVLATLRMCGPGVAAAAVGTVTWTPAPPPTVNGVVQPYTDFRLYRCLGGPALCPASNASVWTLQDTFPTADCGGGSPPCTATTTVSVGPGTAVTMSFYMTARIGPGTGQESLPSPVVSAVVPGGPDVPLQPPGSFQLQFSGLDVPLRVVDGTIGTAGKLIVAATERDLVDATIVVHIVADHRRRS